SPAGQLATAARPTDGIDPCRNARGRVCGPKRRRAAIRAWRGSARMRVSVVGTGYVGLVTGACLAESGHDVLCLDADKAKIEGLRDGQVPIYEPGLQGLVAGNVEAGRLRFSLSMEEAV